MQKNLKGSLHLVSFILKRERISSPVWIAVLVAFSVAIAGAFVGLFDEAAGCVCDYYG